MFNKLSDGFRNAKLKLQGKTTLTEENIKYALKDVRMSLIEADVEIEVMRTFLQTVKERCLGDVVTLKTKGKQGKMQVSASDHFINICHEELINLMGPVDATVDMDSEPSVIMMVGLQGSGKTTTSGKLAKKLTEEGKKVLMVAADIYRPAAIEQLKVLGKRLGVEVFTLPGMKPVQLCELAMHKARNQKFDVVIFDTAGRLALDNELMQELVDIKTQNKPNNIFFVCDAMIGQSAVMTAKEFDAKLDFTGFILTKLDGDARGGAALSIKAVTGKPIKFLGMGEDLKALEEFRPEGLADRILGFGDVVGLMKDFGKVVDEKEAEQDAKKMLSGNFTFGDFMKQIQMIQKMGSMRSLLERMPGMGELLRQIPAEALDDKELIKVQVMIQSMTKEEQRLPDLIDTSRMHRIAKGSGRSFEEVQGLLERFLQTRAMMGQLGQSGMMQNLMNGMNPFAGGGNPFGGGGNPFGGGMPPMGGMGGMNPFGMGLPQKKTKKKNSSKDLAAARRRKQQQKQARKKNRK